MQKILIIDDEEDLLFLLGSILKRKGFEVESLSSGATVDEKVNQFKPDIILLDIKLDNGYDGRIICRNIKSQNAVYPKIFLFSGHIRAGDHDAGICGDEFFEKPIQISELLKKIDQHTN